MLAAVLSHVLGLGRCKIDVPRANSGSIAACQIARHQDLWRMGGALTTSFWLSSGLVDGYWVVS